MNMDFMKYLMVLNSIHKWMNKELCKHGFSTCVLLNITDVKYKKLLSF